ncbi:MAG TPA: LapA family protein [Acidimicrobiales bacterium]|nr:LapA family protein [Acidimicrobiales bacterium]
MVQQSPGGNSSRARLSGGAIASLTGVGLLVIFMVQNTEKVTLHFLVWNFTWPLWLLTLFTAIFGALVWFGLGVLRRHRRRVARREERRD